MSALVLFCVFTFEIEIGDGPGTKLEKYDIQSDQLGLFYETFWPTFAQIGLFSWKSLAS